VIRKILLAPLLASGHHRPFIGGQAVIEGVMFRSPQSYAVAVRRPDGGIALDAHDKPALTTRLPWKLPLIRGLASLYESLDVGMKALMWSAEIAEPPEEGKPVRKATFWEKAGVIAISFGFGLGLFVGVPYLLAFLLKGPLGITTEGSVLFNIIDGFLRVAIFFGYLGAISLMKDVRRLFAYHGAEHKIINTFEHGREPRADNVAAASRFHPRCGTSFLVILLLVLIFCHSLVFSILPGDLTFFVKLLVRLAMVLPIAAIAYELIRLGSRFPNNKIINFFLLPGLLTHFLTTREPEPDMVEVALASFVRVREKIE
jgi:uncharacterized protein YqhQ